MPSADYTRPEERTEQELLAGIYKAVATIKTILVLAVLLGVVGVLVVLASAD